MSEHKKIERRRIIGLALGIGFLIAGLKGCGFL
jgi:hypothetical protein